MKKKLSKILIATLLFGCVAGITPALAANEAQVLESKGSTVVTRADQFLEYYRTVNGVNQYRIWNATKGCWIMPWTNC